MSTPRMSAPSFAAGSAVVPSPQPRSRTRIPGLIPRFRTSDSPLSRMVAAIRVKSPFSHRALFGLIGVFIVMVKMFSKAKLLVLPLREMPPKTHLIGLVRAYYFSSPQPCGCLGKSVLDGDLPGLFLVDHTLEEIESSS